MKKQLLTNCHVIEGRPLVWIKQADKLTRANVVAGDSPTDRCILSVEQESLDPVQGFRKYENLMVGEEVYKIGSPSGLESTLGQGIISGLRQLDSQRLIQTTAPISPGSSGGGLFDQSGNVIGITTFMVGQGQSLNFAIATEDYFR
jgi:S1-C subfamily serine protease